MLRPLLLALTALLFAAPAAQACPDQPLVAAVHAVARLRAVPGRATGLGASTAAVGLALGGAPVGRRRASLSIPAGATAVSAPVCITLAPPDAALLHRAATACWPCR